MGALLRRSLAASAVAVCGLAVAERPGSAVVRAEPAGTGRVVVGLEKGADPHRVAAAAGARLTGPQIPQLDVITVRPLDGADPAEVLRRLRVDGRVRHASAEGRFALRLPDDPALRATATEAHSRRGVPLQWAAVRHGFPRAWDVTRGRGAVVAVLDTGVDAGHPDLQGKVSGALDLDEGSHTPATVDEDGHGTHVGSLACAATDNGRGIAGAGHDCTLLVLKTDLSDASVISGIVAAADDGAHALNMSFGDDGHHPSPALAEALAYAAARGVVLVAAAADEPVEEQGEPANLLQPAGTGRDLDAGMGLTVTAAGMDDRRARFAGWGSQVSIAAYGSLRSDAPERGLFGLYPTAETPRELGGGAPPYSGCGCRATLEGEDAYAFLPGTSMAAPHVAAAAALVRRLNPDLSAFEVVRLLKQTARRPPGGWSGQLGWGVLDAGAAVRAARRIDRVAPESRLGLPRAAGARRLVLRWQAQDRARPRLLPSGVARYEVWGGIDEGEPRRIAVTRRGGIRIRVQAGRRYALHTIAVDDAGNRELAPEVPDVVVTVSRSGVAASRPSTG